MFTVGKAASMSLLAVTLIVFSFLTFFWTGDIRDQSNACYGSNSSVNAIVDVYHTLAKTSYQLALAALVMTLTSSLYFIMAAHPEVFRFFQSGYVSRAIGFLAATGSILTHLFLVSLISFNVLSSVRSSYRAIAPAGTCSFAKVDQLIAFEWVNFSLVIAIIIVGHWWSHQKHSHHHHSIPLADDGIRVYMSGR